MLRTLLAALAAVAATVSLSVTGAAAPASAATPIQGRAQLTAEQMASWYAATGQTADLPISVGTLARLYLEEGAAEGIRGDIAFAQAVLETGYFNQWGSVPPHHNNYAGIGATGGGVPGAAFPTPRIGVRAQIQHLRAYADPNITPERLAYPLESPRFHLVAKGSAPNWDDLGGGRWAVDPDYARKILSIYGRIAAHPAPSRAQLPPARGLGHVCPEVPRTSRFTDIGSTPHADAINCLSGRRVALGVADGEAYRPNATINRAQTAAFLDRVLAEAGVDLPDPATVAFRDAQGVHAPAIERLAAAGLVSGCREGRFCPMSPVTRGQMASMLAAAYQQAAGNALPGGQRYFDDVAGTTHERAIAALAAAGVARGRADTTFGPGAPVTRGQMATFVAGLLDLLAEGGHLR